VILVESKMSAPTSSGTLYQLFRWRCSACSRYGVYLLKQDEALRNGASHAATHVEARP
jgi:hypothetical protein